MTSIREARDWARAAHPPSGPLPSVRNGRTNRDGGQAVVEFAMVLPLIALIVFVFILFGKAVWAYIEVTHAANEGARLAAVNQPTSGTLSAFLKSEYALPNGASIAICYPSENNPSSDPNVYQDVGQPVQVDVYSSASWVPIINLGQIKAAATMRIEQNSSANATLAANSSFDSATGLCTT